MKSAHLPLVVTAPYAAALREKALALAAKAGLRASPQPSDSLSMDVDGPSDKPAETDSASESPLLWVLQRQMRAALVRQQLTGNPSATAAQTNAVVVHPPVALGPTNYVTELLAHRSFYRNRKQQKRDVKAWEKEDRRRRLELEDRRKKKAVEYHKALMAHREDFFRFHKSRKFGTLCHTVMTVLPCACVVPSSTRAVAGWQIRICGTLSATSCASSLSCCSSPFVIA